MRLQAYDDNGTMKFRQVSGSQALDSLPVGTTIGYSGSVAPNGYLFCDGSTFDAAKYPELYSILGSDTLPELFDHDRRDTAYTNIRSEVGSTVQTAYEMPYDGDISFIGSGYNQNYCSITVLKADGTTIDWNSSFAGSYDESSSCGGTALFLNKGDKFCASANSSLRSLSIQARFYKQHLLIKAATIGISDVSINAVKTALTPGKIEELGNMSGHNSLANAVEMPYSGLLIYRWSSASSTPASHILHIVYDDGTETTIALASISYSADSRTIAVQKGWKIYSSSSESSKAVASIQKLFI